MKKYVFLSKSADLFLSDRLHLATKLKQDGYHVYVVTQNSKLCDKINELGFSVCKLEFYQSAFGFVKKLIKTYKILKTIGPDVINSYSFPNNLQAAILSNFFSKTKTVLCISKLTNHFGKKTIVENVNKSFVFLLYAIFFKNKNIHFLFLNDYDKDLFLSKGWAKEEKSFLVAGTGIDNNEFQVINKNQNDCYKILFPDIISSFNGLQDLVEAAAILLSKTPIAFEVLICDRLDKESNSVFSKHKIREIVRNKSIRFLGKQNSMESLFQEADIVCLPVAKEGIPKVLIEACAYGKAIITYDLPNSREVVKDNYNGWLVKPYDKMDLAYKLEKLMLNSLVRKEFSNNSKQLALTKFDINKVYQDIKKIVA